MAPPSSRLPADGGVRSVPHRPHRHPFDPGHVGSAILAMYSFLSRTSLMVKETTPAHLAQVVGAGAAHLAAHHLRFLDDLLDRQLSDDAPQ